MAVIDREGRLFGRINLIDAMVGVAIAGLVPLGFGAYLLFRTPRPSIASVEPARIDPDRPVTLRVSGSDLRPYLRARLGTIDASAFLIESPSAADVKFPALVPGRYDFILLDEGRELARKPGAVTVNGRVDAGRPRAAVGRLQVRFAAWPGVFEHVKVADVDVSATSDSGEGATLTAVGSMRREDGRIFGIPQELAVFEATVRLPLQMSAGWQYAGRPVRIGAPFSFDTGTYHLDGWVVDLAIEGDASGRAR
jgi:hypothetical protein